MSACQASLSKYNKSSNKNLEMGEHWLKIECLQAETDLKRAQLKRGKNTPENNLNTNI